MCVVPKITFIIAHIMKIKIIVVLLTFFYTIDKGKTL